MEMREVVEGRGAAVVDKERDDEMGQGRVMGTGHGMIGIETASGRLALITPS